MENQKEITSVGALEKLAGSASRAIQDLEKKAGYILLGRPDSPVSDGLKQAYAELEEKKESCKTRIGEISDLDSRIKDLDATLSHLQKDRTDLSAGWNDCLKELGTALVKKHSSATEEACAGFYREALAELDKADKAGKEQSKLKDGLDNQAFWTRMASQVKNAALTASVAASRKKFDAIVTKGAAKVWEDKTLEAAYKSGIMDITVLDAYKACAELAGEEQQLDEKISEVRKSKQSVMDSLAELGAEKPEKTIDTLRRGIDGFDADIARVCADAGHEYAARYVSPDGEKIKKCPASTDASLVSIVGEIAGRRVELAGVNLQLAVLRLENRIADTEKSIDAMKRSIAANQDKIEKLKQQNEKTAADMTEKSGELDALKAELDGLKKPEQEQPESES